MSIMKLILIATTMLAATAVMWSQNTTPCIQNPGAPNPWPNPGAAGGGFIELGNMGQPPVFSISVWVNPNAVQNAQSILLDCSHGGNANWVIQSINGGATWGFLGANFVLQAGRWQHLLCTYNNGVTQVYVDGNFVVQANGNINWQNVQNVYLGNWPEGGRRFNGLVDELYITNNILYNANFTPVEQISNADILPNTFGLWHFDEGTGLVTQNAVSQLNTAINNWVWQARQVTQSNSSIKNSYQVAADLLKLGSPNPTQLLFGTGSGTITLSMPSTSGTLAVQPMNLTPPVGTVVQYLGQTLPTGYIASNGQDVSRTTYSNLFTTVGTTYGSGNGTSTFTLPDVGPIPVNGLVGWWPFNGNANDESGVGTNGVVTGATLTTDRFGYNNSAYYCRNNADLVRVTNYPELVNPKGSVSFWFVTSYKDAHVLLYIETFPGNTNEHVSVSWTDYPNRLEGCAKFNSNCKPGKGWVKGYTQASYQDNLWHHVVMTWGDGFVRTYVDGPLVAEAATPTLNADVCAGPDLLLTGYTGKIDDVAIYNRILNESERQRLFGADSPRIVPIVKY